MAGTLRPGLAVGVSHDAPLVQNQSPHPDSLAEQNELGSRSEASLENPVVRLDSLRNDVAVWRRANLERREGGARIDLDVATVRDTSSPTGKRLNISPFGPTDLEDHGLQTHHGRFRIVRCDRLVEELS